MSQSLENQIKSYENELGPVTISESNAFQLQPLIAKRQKLADELEEARDALKTSLDQLYETRITAYENLLSALINVKYLYDIQNDISMYKYYKETAAFLDGVDIDDLINNILLYQKLPENSESRSIIKKDIESTAQNLKVQMSSNTLKITGSNDVCDIEVLSVSGEMNNMSSCIAKITFKEDLIDHQDGSEEFPFVINSLDKYNEICLQNASADQKYYCKLVSNLDFKGSSFTIPQYMVLIASEYAISDVSKIVPTISANSITINGEIQGEIYFRIYASDTSSSITFGYMAKLPELYVNGALTKAYVSFYYIPKSDNVDISVSINEYASLSLTDLVSIQYVSENIIATDNIRCTATQGGLSTEIDVTRTDAFEPATKVIPYSRYLITNGSSVQIYCSKSNNIFTGQNRLIYNDNRYGIFSLIMFAESNSITIKSLKVQDSASNIQHDVMTDTKIGTTTHNYNSEIIAILDTCISSNDIQDSDASQLDEYIRTTRITASNDAASALNIIGDILDTIDYIELARQSSDEYYNTEYCTDGESLRNTLTEKIQYINASDTESQSDISIESLVETVRSAIEKYESTIAGCVLGIIELNDYIEQYGVLFEPADNYGTILEDIISDTSDLLVSITTNDASTLSLQNYSKIRTYTAWKNKSQLYTNSGKQELVQLYIGSELGFAVLQYLKSEKSVDLLALDALKTMVKSSVFTENTESEYLDNSDTLFKKYGMRVIVDASYESVPPVIIKLIPELNFLSDMNIDGVLKNDHDEKEHVTALIKMPLIKYITTTDDIMPLISALTKSCINFKCILIKKCTKETLESLMKNDFASLLDTDDFDIYCSVWQLENGIDNADFVSDVQNNLKIPNDFINHLYFSSEGDI